MSQNKRIFITGTSGGFGFNSAKALAERGHTVFATMRGANAKNKEKAEELQSFASAGNHAITVLDLDVTDDASIKKAVTTAIESGGIDVLINNAGVGNWGIDEGFSTKQAQQLFDINVFGVMRLNQLVVPHFRSAGKGLLMYVSSGVGRIVFPFMAAYTASKFALEAYAESTSYELAPLGIQSVIVQPGAYGTSFFMNVVQPENDKIGEYGVVANMFQAFSSGFEESAKAGTMGDPAEVTKAIVHEVELDQADRPLRHPVGQDMIEPVSMINETHHQVQDQLLTAFGLK